MRESLQDYINDIDYDINKSIEQLDRMKEFSELHHPSEFVKINAEIETMKAINEVLKDIVKEN